MSVVVFFNKKKVIMMIMINRFAHVINFDRPSTSRLCLISVGPDKYSKVLSYQGAEATLC